MPVIGASTATDFAGGEQRNTRIRFDGQIELASRNLLTNPDARDLDARDDPVGINLGAAGEPSGWGVYIRKLTDSRTTRQTLSPLPIQRDFHVQKGPLIEGPVPQDVTRRARIVRPRDAPWCEAVPRANVGYVGGWRGLAFGWIVDGNPLLSPYITDPSPRVAVNLATGEGADLPLPETAPEGATGVYVAMTERRATENAALTAALWIQRRLDARRGMRATYALDGPFRKEERAPGSNQTYQGGANQWPAPFGHYFRANQTLKAFTSRLSFSFLTEFGWSKPQNATPEFTTPAGYRAKLGWSPPRLPGNARAWRPEFVGKDKQWYALKPKPVGKFAFIWTNDPEDYPEGAKPEAVERGRSLEAADETGIPAPDAAPETPLISLSATLEPGVYETRAVWYDESDRETPPSPPRRIAIALGQSLRVVRPVTGNLIPNADASAVDSATGEADQWELIPTARFTATTIKGGVVVKDSSGAATDENSSGVPLARLPPLVLSGERRLHIRTLIRMDRYVSGAVAVNVRFHNPDRSLVEQIHVATRTSSGLVAGSIGIAGTGAAITIPSWATHVRLVTRQIGTSATAGVRNLDYTAYAHGFFQGLTAPRTYARGLWPRPSVENPEDLYPVGGTCVLVEDPQGRHPDLAGKALNAVEYWGPDGTPKSHDYFLTEGSYRAPVRPGQTYTLSAYVDYEGVNRTTEYFVTATKDARGRVLVKNPALVPNVSGTAPATRYATTFTAPAGAAYVEIISGGGSDGFARAMAFQLDEGPVVSAYTNENALSGYRRVTFDTGLPGVPASSKLADLGRVAAWIGGGTIHTLDPGGSTSVNASFRSTDVDPASLVAVDADWSAWTGSFENVPRRRFWQIEAALFSTDPLQSPAVSWMGLEIARPHPVLLRSDGTEYPGGVQVVDMPPALSRRKRETFVADNNVRGTRASGRFVKSASGFGLEAYLDGAVHEVVKDMYEGGLAQVIEYYDLDKRFTVLLDPETVSFEVEREAHWTFDAPHHWIHRASGIECEVTEEERLR